MWHDLDRTGIAITSPLTHPDLECWKQELERRGLSYETQRVGERALITAIFPSDFPSPDELWLALLAAAERLERLLGLK